MNQLALCLGVVMFVTGCGSKEPSAEHFKTVPAQGTLTFNGKPLAYYQVMLFPENARPAAGTTDEQGHFVLGTNSTGDGAVVGKHKVTVVFVGPPSDISPDADGYQAPVPTVKTPTKYGRVESTDISLDVPAGGSDTLVIDLK